MDLDKALVVSILREGKPGLRKALEYGVTSEGMAGEGAKAFQFILDYSKKNGVMPEESVVSMATQVALDFSVGGVADFWANAIQDRKLSRVLETMIVDVHSKIAKPREALEHIEQTMTQLRNQRLAGTLVESLPGLGQTVIDFYERMKSGETGIKAPWETVNASTMGFWPEDLVLFVARLGIGKTWTSLLLAGHAWEQQIRDADGTMRPVRVLYATTEMSKERIAQRWYCIKLQLPYGAFRSGKLSTFQEDNLRAKVKEFEHSPNFSIVGGNFDFSMESFDAAIDEAKADIVVLDGAYLLKVQGLTRQERAANVFDELKRINKRRKVPILVTMQFNREVKTNAAKTVQAESIALTDVAGWNADLIFGLVQTEEMKLNKRMLLKPLKVREGESVEFECNWDFTTMNFSELAKAAMPGMGGGGSGGAGGGGGSDASDVFPDGGGGAAAVDPFSNEVPF